MRARLPAVFVAFVGTASVAVAIVHTAALLASAVFWGPGHISAVDLTGAMLLLAAVFAVASLLLSDKALQTVGVVVPLAAGAWFALRWGAPADAIGLAAVALLQAVVARNLANRLSVGFAGVNRRPAFNLRAVLWTLAALLILVQSARLSTFMADPSYDWWLTTRDPLWAQHMCMPAYIEAADLDRQGVANVYDEKYYAVLVRNAKPPITVKNMNAFIGDPFQYPPPFLVLPRLALAATDDFLAMRTVWYSIQVVTFLLVALVLCRCIGGQAGVTAAWLIPVVWLSLPVMQSLQYGQFHLAAIALAAGAFVAFESRRPATGGALLAVAMVSKIFPGVLLLLLLVQKRWREAAWTAGFAALFTAAALLVLGWQPFDAFLHYQLPRLADGRAFDFAAQWPELRVPLVVIDNIAPGAVLSKLQELGVAGVAVTVAPWIRRAFTLLLVALVAVAAVRPGSTRGRAIVWLALLNLSSLQGYSGWADYITLGSVWMLTLLVPELRRSVRFTVLLGTCWVFCALLPGAQPVPYFLPTRLALVLTTALSLVVVALNVFAIWHVSRAALASGRSGEPAVSLAPGT